MLVCLKYCLSRQINATLSLTSVVTHAKTLEKSVEGDITKLSLLADQDIKFWMLGSSNMLGKVSNQAKKKENSCLSTGFLLVQLVDERGLYYFGLLGRRCGRSTQPISHGSVLMRGIAIGSVAHAARMIQLWAAMCRWAHRCRCWRGDFHRLAMVGLYGLCRRRQYRNTPLFSVLSRTPRKGTCRHRSIL